ncbi:MAG TPA: FAD:protein FMN transferase ApbE, partial [Pantoea septica]|nr:FAD:protein FMN transferase ApbE [Pantoea septica]
MRYWNILLMTSAVFALSACDSTTPPQAMVLEGKTMGTVWRVSLAGVDAAR